MKRTVVIVCIAFCAVAVLSLAEDEKNSQPSVTMSSADEFNPNITIPTTNSTTTTTKATTTTTKSATTTAKPTTTTTKATTTTAKSTTTTTKATTTTTKPATTTAKPTTTTTKPTTTTAKSTTTTTKATTTTTKPATTTAKPTTTTTKPTTTTAKPTTTTTKATTTTTNATTTTKPTNTTTKPTITTTKPTTTTTKATTPSPPEPTPSTNLTGGNYTLMTDKKVICLMAQMALQIRLATPKVNGTFIVQPKLTKAVGFCQETKANLTLVFKEGFITFMFNKSAADNTVYVDALSFVFSYPFNKGGNSQYTANNNSVHLFAAKVGRSYSCKSESLYMGNGLYLDVSQDRMQAFNLTKSNEFGLPDFCAADQHDYRVAIAIGVILLVLIIIVVVVYLLGRRKRINGYQSL